MFNPGFYMTEAWYKSCLCGIAVYAVGGAFVGLWGLTGFELLLYVTYFCAVVGTMAILGGLACLFRYLFGKKALNISVVASVILIIIACISFFILVPTGKIH